MVRRHTGSVDRQSQGASSKERFPQAPKIVIFPSVYTVSAASCLDVIKRQLRGPGFSEDVTNRIAQPIRGSSLAIYQSKWAIFCGWCSQQEIDPFNPAVTVIAEFLTGKFKGGRAPSTFAGYRML